MATSSFPALGNDEEGAQDARLGPWPKQRLVDSELDRQDLAEWRHAYRRMNEHGLPARLRFPVRRELQPRHREVRDGRHHVLQHHRPRWRRRGEGCRRRAHGHRWQQLLVHLRRLPGPAGLVGETRGPEQRSDPRGASSRLGHTLLTSATPRRLARASPPGAPATPSRRPARA